MPTRQWFAPQAEEAVKRALLNAKKQARERRNEDLELARAYLENRQLDDVEQQLNQRYEKTQRSNSAQRIAAVSVPIVQRFVDDAATLYNHRVKRRLVDDAGQETTETKTQTDKYNQHMDLIAKDEAMHEVERALMLMRAMGIWWQAKRGRAHIVLTYPQWVFPVIDKAEINPDPADPDDYAAMIVQLAADADDMGSARTNRYAIIAPAETRFFNASNPYEPEKFVGEPARNPLTWLQVLETGDQKGLEPREMPMQMFTMLHARYPIGGILPCGDIDLVIANREINVQLSVLLDTMRTQGWATTSMNLFDPNSAPPVMASGTRFPYVLGPGESMQMASSGVNYAQLVAVLQDFIRMLAISYRSSPNDFSLVAQAALSGFAKQVDSLPKLERRDEHAARMRRQEQSLLWPRECSILTHLGVLDQSARRMRLVVEFDPIAFPMTSQEEAQKNQSDVDMGLTTPAEILARRTGMALEDAKKKIVDNLAEAKANAPAQTLEQSATPGQESATNDGFLGQLIRRKTRTPIPGEDNA